MTARGAGVAATAARGRGRHGERRADPVMPPQGLRHWQNQKVCEHGWHRETGTVDRSARTKSDTDTPKARLQLGSTAKDDDNDQKVGGRFALVCVMMTQEDSSTTFRPDDSHRGRFFALRLSRRQYHPSVLLTGSANHNNNNNGAHAPMTRVAASGKLVAHDCARTPHPTEDSFVRSVQGRLSPKLPK